MHRMATQKRRVIYLSDPQWQTAQRDAAKLSMTASAYIGRLVERSPAARDRAVVAAARAEWPADPPPLMARPFTPVPKPSQRK